MTARPWSVALNLVHRQIRRVLARQVLKVSLIGEAPYVQTRRSSSLSAHREWTEVVAELDRRGLMWIVADVIAELVPTGRAAVEAHKAIYDYLSPQHVGYPFGIASNPVPDKPAWL